MFLYNRLIAIMLGRLEMDVDQCIAAYGYLAEEGFVEKRSHIPDIIMREANPRFDLVKLQIAILEVLEQSGVSETDFLSHGTKRGCRT